MRFRLEQAKLKNAHPNSVQLHLVGESGKVLDLIGQSWAAPSSILQR